VARKLLVLVATLFQTVMPIRTPHVSLVLVLKELLKALLLFLVPTI
jgi:hypothetical protein